MYGTSVATDYVGPSIHSLRHTFATELIANKADVKLLHVEDAVNHVRCAVLSDDALGSTRPTSSVRDTTAT